MTRAKRQVDDEHYVAFTRRILTAAGQRGSLADPELLGQLLQLSRSVDEAIATAVRGMRASGATWADIGAATGTSRQAAWVKWSDLG